MRGKNFFWGIILIFIGVGAILNNIFNIHLFTISQLWPVFVLIPGLSFEEGYFSRRKDPGLLVPGGILTTIGILFFFETFTNWHFAEYTWPVYLLAVAIGLFQLYLFGGRKRGLLVPVFILTTISVIAFATMLVGNVFYWVNTSLLIPIILIALGVYMVSKNFRK
ncbi:DUF5668 domain-containing protein [Clostridium estertheticum]|uniref:LiaI-LiaF-like domain-containing protein n=1 Tax=Clostridium estertheticum TaxID=238834 RepID=UPI0013E949E6|nr:DUF5668 domain-containing protein [Clostridium estertheticum]MBZ9685571.1 DUF5668 domain-containing protein [Clostridium estertheticum]